MTKPPANAPALSACPSRGPKAAVHQRAVQAALQRVHAVVRRQVDGLGAGGGARAHGGFREAVGGRGLDGGEGGARLDGEGPPLRHLHVARQPRRSRGELQHLVGVRLTVRRRLEVGWSELGLGPG